MAVLPDSTRSRVPASAYWAALAFVGVMGFSRLCLQVIGPPLGGAVGDRYGLFTTIVLSGFLWLAGAACALLIDRHPSTGSG